MNEWFAAYADALRRWQNLDSRERRKRIDEFEDDFEAHFGERWDFESFRDEYDMRATIAIEANSPYERIEGVRAY